MNEIKKAEQHAKDHPDAPVYILHIQGGLYKLYCGSLVRATSEDCEKYREWKQQKEKEEEEEEEKKSTEKQLRETLDRAHKLANEQTPPSVTKVTEELEKNAEKE